MPWREDPSRHCCATLCTARLYGSGVVQQGVYPGRVHPPCWSHSAYRPRSTRSGPVSASGLNLARTDQSRHEIGQFCASRE